MDTEWLHSIPKDFTQRMPWQYLESTINKPADLYNKNSYDKLNEYDNGLFEHNLYNSKGIASADPKTATLVSISHTALDTPDKTQYLYAFEPVILMIESKLDGLLGKLERAKLNLNLPIGDYDSNTHMFPHKDITDGWCRSDGDWRYTNPSNFYSCIYYLTDTDGDLFLFDNIEDNEGIYNCDNMRITNRITPKENTAVFFNSNTFHAGSYSTKKARVCLNLVWEGT